MKFLEELDYLGRFGRTKYPVHRYSDGGASGGDGSSGSTGEGDKGSSGDEGDSKATFDDLLKDKDYQSEFDKRVSKALETAKVKWQKDTDDKLSEAQKMAKMNADEKAKYEFQKREDALAKREAETQRKELLYTAKDILAEKGLPAELSEVLNFENADKCNKSIDTLEKVFRSEVQKAVEQKLKDSGYTPKTGDEKTSDPFLEGLGIKK